jgi:hypothetical protein
MSRCFDLLYGYVGSSYPAPPRLDRYVAIHRLHTHTRTKTRAHTHKRTISQTITQKCVFAEGMTKPRHVLEANLTPSLSTPDFIARDESKNTMIALIMFTSVAWLSFLKRLRMCASKRFTFSTSLFTCFSTGTSRWTI